LLDLDAEREGEPAIPGEPHVRLASAAAKPGSVD